MINLISDTVTKPTKGMLEAMMKAPVGDDVFRQDPTVNKLEETAADMFGMEAALFCPSGTMTNQIAIKVHTQPLDEMICHSYSHIYQYETGGFAFNSGISICLLDGPQGKIMHYQIDGAIKDKQDWLPRSKLVVIENTTNKGGGAWYTLEEIRLMKKVCEQFGLRLHMDGARFFNAMVEEGYTPAEVGSHLDSISICLSKGLGAPVGSLLIGNADFIAEARRFRKVMGGGMRQAGFLAAAGLYALENHIDRLKEDHEKAHILAHALESHPKVIDVLTPLTNIVLFDINGSAGEFVMNLASEGVIASAFGPHTVRFVTHLDVSRDEVLRMDEILQCMSGW